MSILIIFLTVCFSLVIISLKAVHNTVKELHISSDQYSCVHVNGDVTVCTPSVVLQYKGLEIEEWETNKQLKW
jgi:hypothetical protein